MFAVMKTGGKQYKVSSGDVLRVERLAANAGETIQFNEILMVGDTVGTPLVEGAGVQAEVIDQIKGEKLIHYVKRRRKHSSQRTKGHRQKLTLLRVTEILTSGADATGVKAAIGTGSLSVAALAALQPASNNRPKANPADSAQHGKIKAPKAKREKAAPTEDAAPAVVEASADAAVIEATKPANLLTEAREGGADDLKRISGVGPKLEGLLHENGVFHFDQIMAWGPADIAYMDDKLSFKGRIERDNWIEQATTLNAEKE